jgi:hypothetical protein
MSNQDVIKRYYEQLFMITDTADMDIWVHKVIMGQDVAARVAWPLLTRERCPRAAD